tara:strand:+ start:2054 stop:2404 length:351 start_codon:yes stop_codon:yes gene_type:complete
MNKLLVKFSVIVISAMSLIGCNKTQEGAAFGAGIGALAGQAIGGDTEGTLIGAGAGALLGGMYGNSQQSEQSQSGSTTMRRTTIHETLDADGNVIKTGTTTTTSSQTSGGYTGLED